jgi:putative queuosine salvage protein
MFAVSGTPADGSGRPGSSLAVVFTDDIRRACARVADAARHVRIVEDAIEPYAQTLASESPPAPDLDGATLEERAAYSLTLNAINFGSGWFPTLRKVEGKSGYWTVEAGVREHGPWSADALAAMSAEKIAAVTGQDPEHELMGHYARHLRELGERVRDAHDGSFLALARSGEGSAERLAEHLGGWPTWRDVSVYEGFAVPFFKRAQIAAADLALAGIAPVDDLDRLTLFADNLVPHVLRIDGVLEFDPELVARIDAEQLIEHDSREEVEIRACALHAVERLVAAHGSTTATAVDNVLWHRGAAPRYKAHPRHRARTTDY